MSLNNNSVLKNNIAEICPSYFDIKETTVSVTPTSYFKRGSMMVFESRMLLYNIHEIL